MNLAPASPLQKINIVLTTAALIFTIIMGICIFFWLGAEPQPEDFEFSEEKVETSWYIIPMMIAPVVSTYLFFCVTFKKEVRNFIVNLIQLIVSIGISVSIIIGFVQYFK